MNNYNFNIEMNNSFKNDDEEFKSEHSGNNSKILENCQEIISDSKKAIQEKIILQKMKNNKNNLPFNQNEFPIKQHDSLNYTLKMLETSQNHMAQNSVI